MDGIDSNQILQDSNMGFCHLGKGSQVLSQSTTCQNYCGNRVGKVCEGGCPDFFNGQSPSRKLRLGFHIFEGKEILGKMYDIMMVNNKDSMISFLRPLDLNNKGADEVIAPQVLTPREMEIFKLRMNQRISVTDIAKKLEVSRATVRTHINNINKKLVNIS